MRLFIAEKPSLARAIADALPAPQRRARLHIECGSDVVAWCAGHILAMAPPEAYADEYKTWRLEHLPIAPRAWKLDVSAPELLGSIARLLKTAARVVHAGDPDREGQLLVDEVLHFLGYEGPVDRLLVRDLSPDAVRAQLAALEPNAKYRPLSESALARQRADWLYGINMTRLYTLLGRAAGYEGVLSVGRVQTPLLGLVVARDRAIAAFRPVAHYAVAAEMGAGGEGRFRAVWVPSLGEHLDADGRVLARAVAEAACGRLRGKAGRVTACADEKKSEPAPLPHALADLQMEAGRRHGLSAAEVLEACQSLYETHRLLTYPRSDCAYLPERQHAEARGGPAARAPPPPTPPAAARGADLTLRSRAWNDRKVSAHHAIIPTPSTGGAAAELTPRERAVYELAARRYLVQFCAPHEFLETKVELEVEGERFTAAGRQILALGWRALAHSDGDRDDDEPPHGGDAQSSDRAVRLPPLEVGDPVTALRLTVEDKRTEPPKPFTDASLIAAMCGVAKFVRSPAAKKILTEADGIGTPATRAAIIETLFERGYAVRVRRTIVSTETGRALVRNLPKVATTPDMTAVWEAAMRAVCSGAQTLDAFVARVSAQLEALVADGRALGRIAVPAAAAPPPPPPPRAHRAHPASPSRPTSRRRPGPHPRRKAAP
jgi:DNA topoisomerase-3